METTNETKKLTGRVTKQQKLKLLELMKANRSVGRGQYTSKCSGNQHNLYWKKVASELNCMGASQKSPDQWKRCWIDWKAAVKKQYGKIKAFNLKTGNRPLSEGPKPLEKMDNDLIQFFSTELVEGDGVTPEAGFGEETIKVKTGPRIMVTNKHSHVPSTSRAYLDEPSTSGAHLEEEIVHLEEPSISPVELDEPAAIQADEAAGRMPPPRNVSPDVEAPNKRLRTSSGMHSCFEEAKNIATAQNNLILEQLQKMNNTMCAILNEVKLINQKLN